MKIKVLSDLHLEFRDDKASPFHPGTGDILVLAGDICVASHYNKQTHEFFQKCVEGYNRVFYLLGNHEFYCSSIEKAKHTLQEKLPNGITLMDNRSEFVGGVHFIGSTLWTNFDNMNADTMDTARSMMTDYKLIDGFSPENALERHLFTREWFERAIPMLRGPVFVMTHHAPSTKSVKGRYSGSEGMYSSNMESFIKKNPNIIGWCHGHVHESSDYMVEQCRIVANPFGYYPDELNPNFDASFEVEIPDEECYTELVRS